MVTAQTGFASMMAVLLVGGCFPASSDPQSTMVESRSPAIGENGAMQQAVGLETLGGMLTPLLQVGCKLPCESREVFSTAADKQDQITIRLFRGGGPTVAGAYSLGEYRVEGIPPLPRGQPQIEVRVATKDRNLIIEASDVATRLPYRVVHVETR
jgi:molecular chaperone DnaK